MTKEDKSEIAWKLLDEILKLSDEFNALRINENN